MPGSGIGAGRRDRCAASRHEKLGGGAGGAEGAGRDVGGMGVGQRAQEG